ncbi:MAG: Uma2 family endonuclease [Peptococcaceae bacterium]|jgi:Uma2 family endonuclease|nr:Uma2 family endonuclease [Peptococcaceae bacterium]
MDDLREALAEYAVTQIPLKMSLEEFWEWGDEDTWAEWVDGEVIVLSPATASHQKIAFFLARVMDTFARHYESGEVLLAPFAVHLPEHLRRVREPDIIFVQREQLSRFKEASFEGGPDVIVEIVSRDSRTRDRKDKYGEYEAAGVREYWLIDPDRRRVDFFRLGAGGRFHREEPDDEGIFHSQALPGFWLNPGLLWQDPLPSVEDVYLQYSAGYSRVYEKGKKDAARQFLTIRFGEQSAGIQEMLNSIRDLDTLNDVLQELFSVNTLEDARNIIGDGLQRQQAVKKDS